MLGFPTMIALHSIGMAVAAGLTIVVTLYLYRIVSGIAEAHLTGFLRIATWGFMLNLATGLTLFVPRMAQVTSRRTREGLPRSVQ